MAISKKEIEYLLTTIPSRYRGPGGALAVLQEGQLVAEYTWGYADLDKRIPVSTDTLMPICSITKQMVCALIYDLDEKPAPELAVKGQMMVLLSRELRSILSHPDVQDKVTVRHLCDMQSGIRDYWAEAMLLGPKPDDPFMIKDNTERIPKAISSLHFEPGTEFSYCNVNFYLLGRMIENITKRPLADLLEERIFRPAKMTTARLCADTSKHPPPCLGYEGTDTSGYIAAVNRIEWAGDAGIVASLEDMIAYEKYFDERWIDQDCSYRSVALPRDYKDGTSSTYSYGLAHLKVNGVKTIGHGGALRGYRLHRLYAEKERISIVVLFNHEANAGGAAQYILKKVLNFTEATVSDIKPSDQWFGDFLDMDTQLAIRVTKRDKAEINIAYAGGSSPVRLTDATHAESIEMTASISEDVIKIYRIQDNRHLDAKRLPKKDDNTKVISWSGTFHNAALGTTFKCEGQGDALYGAFDGPLGHGPANVMRYLGGDVWLLGCPRGLDAPAPGDWTIVLDRDDSGEVVSFTIGCWLARLVRFVRA